MAIQELGFLGFCPIPFFTSAANTDVETIKNLEGKCRGVGIFSSDPDTIPVNTGDKNNEITAVINHYANSKGGIQRVCIINVYRLIHKDNTRTIDETITAIRNTISIARNKYNTIKCLVVGDFNHEAAIHMNGFREIKNDNLYHRHSAGTRKTYIDRIFTNFDDCGLLEILDPIENRGSDPNTGELFGHKAYALYIGAKPEIKPAKSQARPQAKLIRKLLKEKPNFNKTIENRVQKVNLSETERKIALDEMAIKFSDIIKDINNKATVQDNTKPRHMSKSDILFSEIESAEDSLKHGKKPDKVFFRLGRDCTKGIVDKDTTQPPLNKLAEKHNAKLAKINPTDKIRGRQIVEKIYANKPSIKAKWINDLESFKRAVMSTSNSKAIDALGMSLKQTKVYLTNRTFLKRYRIIADASFKLGHFPKVWREDNIHFIWKNKGDKLDPANFRPITIAPSLGKHLEKLFSILISPFDDQNVDNHAYKSKRSCLTAIIDTQRKLLQAKNKFNKGFYGKMKVFSIISADDISGAFESISHTLVAYALELAFKKEQEANISGFLLSYLKRNSKIVDAITGQFVFVVQIIADQTAPQGSLLSPLLWRIYDNLFVVLYKENLELLMDSDQNIICIGHIAYADDHITVVTFVICEDATDSEIGERMCNILSIMRSLLDDATTQLGCGINPLKSENIVPERFSHLINLKPENAKEDSPSFYGKDTFKLDHLVRFLSHPYRKP